MRSGKNMTRKKKKLSLQQMFERDAGQGLENFDKPPTKVNVFERASKIKTWNMFIHLVEQENITPAEALIVVLKHVKKNWTRLKILKDPQQMEAIANLLKWENKIKRKKLYHSQYLEDFAEMTGYKIPNTFHGKIAATKRQGLCSNSSWMEEETGIKSNTYWCLLKFLYS
jgi:HEAT repeat protein